MVLKIVAGGCSVYSEWMVGKLNWSPGFKSERSPPCQGTSMACSPSPSFPVRAWILRRFLALGKKMKKRKLDFSFLLLPKGAFGAQAGNTRAASITARCCPS